MALAFPSVLNLWSARAGYPMIQDHLPSVMFGFPVYLSLVSLCTHLLTISNWKKEYSPGGL